MDENINENMNVMKENDVLEQAKSNIDYAKEQINQIMEKQQENGTEKLADSNDLTDQFVGVPVESLICGPIIAAARGQQELTQVYIDTVMKLAYEGDGKDRKTNILSFEMERPVEKPDGTIEKKSYTINAPLISLVPIPAFTMDELTVDFNMEVKETGLTQDQTKSDVESTVAFKSVFGLSASITGSVTSDSLHKRETDNSATLTIHARAVQQPPSEGMEKLTSLLSQMMEPMSSQSK